MCPVSVREAHPVVCCQVEAATGVCIRHDLSARYDVGIELVVPGRIQRVGPIDPLAITADLDHLRATGIRLAAGMGRTAGDAADVDGTRKLRLPGLGDVVLTHFTGAPTGNVQE